MALFRRDNLLIGLLEGVKESIFSIIGIEQFLSEILKCKNLFIMFSMFLMISKQSFFVLLEGKAKLFPNCNKHCTSVGIKTLERL